MEDTLKESWADAMDDIDNGTDDGAMPTGLPVGGGDLLAAVAAAFPSPGELWVHLCAACHYLSSVLLDTYPPPWDKPYIVKANGKPPDGSPFRIEYGVHNPALRGTVITSAFVVPSFSWTPRLAVDGDHLAAAMQKPCPGGLLALPAVRGPVVRLFHYNGLWYLATGCRMEPVTQDRPGRIVAQVNACVRRHLPQGLWGLTRDLRTDRVWFFAIFPDRSTILGLGTCRLVSHHELQADVFGAPDYGFTVYGDVAPSIPILPALDPEALAALGGVEGVLSLSPEAPPEYRGLFDGVLLVNPATLFAVRLSSPEAVFLTPLLRHRMPLAEFLAYTVVSSVHPDRFGDHASHAYWTVTQPAMMRDIFADALYGDLLRQIETRVRDIYPWLTTWMNWVTGLPVDEWLAFDLGLQRLYVILDHETPANWPRVVCAPRYHGLVAKAVVFCIEQWP